jgi:transposase-like protein
MRNPFRCLNSSPEVIRLTVMLYIRYPLSLRQVEDLLFERGIATKRCGSRGSGSALSSP